MSQKLKIDARRAHREHANLPEDLTVDGLLSQATYSNDFLYSFGMVRGYNPSIMGLPKTPISAGMLKRHLEQEAKRKLKKLDVSRKGIVLSQQDLPVDTQVYFFKWY